MTQPTFRTPRLTLVPLADEHLELEIELDSDPDVMRYLTGRAHSRAEVEHSHRRRCADSREVPGLGFWVGFAEDGFVGWWLLRPPNGPDQPEVAGEAELGYRLLRHRWRRGYASEGAHELTRYGFADLDRIFARTLAVNRISGGSDPGPVPGAEQGEVEYEITRATWQQRRQHTR
jgi:RimJ/RimL family protein N-acetyltransferase